MKAFAIAIIALLTLKIWGSTIDLDPLIYGAGPGATIQLQAGVYTTKGVNESGSLDPGPRLQPGVKLIGKGQGRTIIILKQLEDRSLTTVWGMGGNLVSDLTIDTGVTNNSTSYSDGKRNGLFLDAGTQPNRVSRVTAMRPYGKLSTLREGFGIIVFGSRSAITDCLVTEPMGDYVQGFGMVGSAMVQNCRVHFPIVHYSASITCFGQSNGTNVSYLNCLSTGGASGFYYDTGNIRDLRIENCIFKDSQVGIQLKNQFQVGLTQTVNRVTIKNNKFFLCSTNDLVAGVVLNNTRLDGAETPHEAGSLNNVTIEGNYFGYSPSAGVPASASNLRQAVALVSNCTNPVVNLRGIHTVTIKSNTYQSIPSGEPWKHRNKWSAATNIIITGESALPFITN